MLMIYSSIIANKEKKLKYATFYRFWIKFCSACTWCQAMYQINVNI